jgi:hypothetical protein
MNTEIEPTDNRHARRRKAKLERMQTSNVGYDSDLDAFSIVEFCRRNSISVSGFYQMKREGWGPDTFFVGKRQLISREAAERWRREREAQSQDSA